MLLSAGHDLKITLHNVLVKYFGTVIQIETKKGY